MPACPLCGGGVVDPFLEAPDPVRPSRRHRASRCRTCGLVRTEAPPPAYEEAFYGIGRFKRLLPGIGAARRRAFAGLPPGRLLDVGSGDGAFVRLARADGWEALGFDPYAPAADLRTLDEADAAGPFDLVTFWQSLEHEDDPVTLLRRARGWLRPGGRIFVSLPNVDSPQARWGGPSWFHLDLPRHRVHFSSTTLEAAAGRAGLRLARLLPGPAWEYEPAGWIGTIANRATGRPNALYNLLKGYAPEATVADRLVAAATFAALPILAPIAVGLSLGLRGRRAGVIEAVLVPV